MIPLNAQAVMGRGAFQNGISTTNNVNKIQTVDETAAQQHGSIFTLPF
jgi:hypothetical protein